MTYIKPLRPVLMSLVLSAACVSAHAQSGDIQAQPLVAPPLVAPPPNAVYTTAPSSSGTAAGSVTSAPANSNRAAARQPYQAPVRQTAGGNGGYTTPGGYVTDGNVQSQAPQAPIPATPSNGTSEEQDIINRADVTLKYMRGNKDYAELDKYLARAKGVFVVPQLIKAAFFFGGEGGDGVILARLPDGTWSAPSFSVIGSASFGLQAGAKSSEIVFLIMTDKGLNAILNRDVKLGAGVSVTLITVGKGLEAATAMDLDADIYAVAKSDGLFGGIALDGSVINPLDGDNEAYYSQKIEARDILNGRVPSPPGAESLIEDLR